MENPVTQVAIPAYDLNRGRKSQANSPDLKYRPQAVPADPDAPYRVTERLVAILADIDRMGMSKPGGRRPFITSYNNLTREQLKEHVPRPVGVLMNTIPLNGQGDQVVTVQVGGKTTILNNGTAEIRFGDWIGVRMPADDLSDMYQSRESAERGIVRPVVFPIRQRSVGSIRGVVERLRRTAAGEIPTHAILADEGRYLFKADVSATDIIADVLAAAVGIGIAAAADVQRTATTVGLGTNSDDQLAAAVGAYGARHAPVFNPSGATDAVKTYWRDACASLLVPGRQAAYANRDADGALENFHQLLASALTYESLQLRECTLGVALSSAGPGKTFDIKLGHGYSV